MDEKIRKTIEEEKWIIRQSSKTIEDFEEIEEEKNFLTKEDVKKILNDNDEKKIKELKNHIIKKIVLKTKDLKIIDQDGKKFYDMKLNLDNEFNRHVYLVKYLSVDEIELSILMD